MNQINSNNKQSGEGPATNSEAQGKPTPQRRYRRPVRAKTTTPAATTSATTPEPAAAASTTATTPPAKEPIQADNATRSAGNKPAPRAKATPKPGNATPQAQTTATAPTTLAAPMTPNGTASQRPRRNQRNARKSGVHLVVPPTAEAPEIAESPEANEINALLAGEAANATLGSGETAASAATDTAITPIPVLTNDTQAASAATDTVATTTEAESAAPSRYRFARRGSNPTVAVPAIRPERLSGPQAAQSAPAVTEAAATSATDEANDADDADAPTQWKADVVEVTPESIHAAPATVSEQSGASRQPSDFDLFAPRTSRSAAAIDDIVSALGLRSAPLLVDPVPAETATDTPTSSDTAASSAVTEPQEDAATEEHEEANANGEGENGSGGRRRRPRRRRSSATHTATDDETEATESAAAQTVTPLPTSYPHSPVVAPSLSERNGFEQYGNAGPFEQPYTPQAQQHAQTAPVWDITTAQSAIQQPDSPFGSPEPNYVRGFGPQPRGVAGPARDLYTTRPTRTERGTDLPPMSSNQLANIVANAIQQQTDRLLTEMRHQQHPPSMTVMFPPFPSTERVGIFVDVANLLYSSRSQRITLDFGKLLEFLRGNRRLIRAHAYAPTNPDPGADQSFLTAVKGMGYRITTKNFKTFSSGAKKADMDLDLCMDIVRMVDAGALDTVVLVSGDSDFLPLLEYCSDHGVRVEAAAFDDSAALILRQSCDLFINLTVATDIRA